MFQFLSGLPKINENIIYVIAIFIIASYILYILIKNKGIGIFAVAISNLSYNYFFLKETLGLIFNQNLDTKTMYVKNFFGLYIYGFYNIIVLYAIIIISIIVYYINFDKEYKIKLDIDYYREAPTDDSPAIVYHLFNNKIDINTMKLCILELIRINAVTLDISNNNIKLTGNKENSIRELSRSEKTMYEFIIDKIGRDNYVTIREIEEVNKKEKTYFNMNFEYYVSDLEFELKEKKIYEDNFYEKNLAYVLNFISNILLMFYVGINLKINNANIILSIIIMIPHLALLVFTCFYLSYPSKKTYSGANRYNKWLAFKNFLDDFSNFKDKSLVEVHIWERFLIYSYAVNSNKKIKDELGFRIKNTDEDFLTVNNFLADFLIKFY